MTIRIRECSETGILRATESVEPDTNVKKRYSFVTYYQINSMDRRTFTGILATVTTTGIAGCLSEEQNDNESTNGGSSDQSSTTGTEAPEDAIETYDQAIELLERNTTAFDDARQQILLNHEDVDFDSSAVQGRVDEAQVQLDLAAQHDDGSLNDEIETLRLVATYQESLAKYNDEYLQLVNRLGEGMDYYDEDRFQPAILTLEDAQDRIGPTRAALDDVDEKLELVLDDESEALEDIARDRLLLAAEDNAEIHQELNWLEQMIPGRIYEIKGTQAIESGTDAFENERFGIAHSEYSDAENYYLSAEVELNQLDIETTTSYIQSLVEDSNRLECEYQYVSEACNELAQASQAMQSNQRQKADDHISNADSHLANSGSC